MKKSYWNITVANVDEELKVDQLLRDYDETHMPIPNMEYEPQLLISQVRKHYMEYLIKLLSNNYETHQRLVNKNIYLPSAIWRCARNIEMYAAQNCMVVQIYRKNIVAMIQKLNRDTTKGKLHNKLLECLQKPHENEKNVQTDSNNNKLDCICTCTCKLRKRRSKHSFTNIEEANLSKNILSIQETECCESTFQPVEKQMVAKKHKLLNFNIDDSKKVSPDVISSNKNDEKPAKMSKESDELMTQLEKLFEGNASDDDLFESALYEKSEQNGCNKLVITKPNKNILELRSTNETVINDCATQIKSLDERLASLTGLITNNNDTNFSQEKLENKVSKNNTSKWLCEEYYMKKKFFDLFDQIRDTNRKKHTRIKMFLLDLFGEDSDDDDGLLSPLEETPEFITSCKDRIAPWVVKLLTPYYADGRIIGKALFKTLAKHLIRLIYQCCQYPQKYEVESFIKDFLANHKIIRCEADFKHFVIENI